MPNPGLTLESIKQSSPKLHPGRVYRASDVLTDEEQAKIRRNRARGRKVKRNFDDVDAYVAEILARFGYEAYRAWNSGEIPADKMTRLLCAERAREASSKLNLYGIIMAMVGATVRKEKGKPAPKGPKIARKIFNTELKRAKGE